MRLVNIKIACAAFLLPTLQGLAQEFRPASSAIDAAVATGLPDAPSAQQQQSAPEQKKDQKLPANSPTSGMMGPFGPVPPVLTSAPLTSQQRLTIYIHETYGPAAVVFSAVGAGIRMANPPTHYPRDWKDGAEAFGRNYGNNVATQTTQRTAKFVTEIALHEDPRYLPAPQGTNVGLRIFHAAGFTFVDRDNTGRRRLAFSNYASAGAGGFVGMAYLPDGYNDVTHAGQRAATQFLQIGVSNIAREFAPELAPIIRKLHLPQIVPPWWVPDHSHGPPTVPQNP